MAAVATGIFLRLDQLAHQIVMDDEFHSVRMVELPYRVIKQTFGDADICIPQTIIIKAIKESIGLDELTLRLLPLIFGVLLLVVLPVLLSRGFSPLTAVIMVWLCAISPLLVLFSRYARPYSVCIFLVTLGVISFIYWSQERRWPWLILYVLCGVLTSYFQILSLVAILSPLVMDSLYHWRNPRRGGTNILIGLLVVMGGLVLLLPALLANFQQLAQKAGKGAMSWQSIDLAVRMLVGTGSGWFCLLLLFGGVAAVRSDFKENPHRTLMLISPLLLQFLSLLVLSPDAISFSVVLARYMVWCWPLVLLAVAWGLSRKLESGGYGLTFKALAPAVLLVLIFLAGPLPGMFSYNNQMIIPKRFFRSLKGFRYRAPAIYHRLAEEPGRFALLEVPYVYFYSVYPYDDYQQVHHRDMYLGFINTLTRPNYDSEIKLSTPGFYFRMFVNLDDRAGLAARGIKYIILHFDLIEEVGRSRVWTYGMHFKPMDMSVPREYLESVYGPPVYQDKALALYRIQPAGDH